MNLVKQRRSTLFTVSHPSLCSGWWWTLREFRQYFPKRLWFKKIKYPLKYCRLTCNWADGATHRSYPHMVLLTMQTRTKGFAPSPTRSLSKYGGICEDYSNMQLNQPIQLLPTLRLCEIPCKRFSLATIATMHQWHLFPPHATHIFLKKGAQK